MDRSDVDISGSGFDRMVLSDDACFLCGDQFADNKTMEHVFPRWLQHRHDLWDHELTLLNGTTIRYSQLTIPCCESCNTTHLATLENRVRTAVEAGYQAAVKLPSINLFQWLGKIYYAILRKELSLLFDRCNGEEGTIVPPELLEGFSTLHMFLQSIRQPFTFQDGDPFTVLTVNLHSCGEEGEFFFRDNLLPMVAALRSKDVGFIVMLQDAGIINNSYGRYVNEVAGRRLASLQFDELYAKCVYQMTLFTRTQKYVTTANDDPKIPTSVHMFPVRGLSSKPILKEWVQTDYVRFLENIIGQTYSGVDVDNLLSSTGHVMSWMTDERGKLMFFDGAGQRIPK